MEFSGARALQFGNIVIDQYTRTVTLGPSEVRLGPTEFRLLCIFMENPGRVFSRQELSARLSGRDDCRPGRKIDVYVGRIRAALTERRGRSPIRTERGHGYVLGNDKKSVSLVPTTTNMHPSVVCRTALGGSTGSSVSIAIPAEKFSRKTGLNLDYARQSVRRLGRDIPLSPRLFALLGLLLSNPGKVFTREQIAKIVCDDSSIDVRTVDAMVARLRKAINRGLDDDPIRTITGLGYKFSEIFHEVEMEWPLRFRKKVRLPNVTDG